MNPPTPITHLAPIAPAPAQPTSTDPLLSIAWDATSQLLESVAEPSPQLILVATDGTFDVQLLDDIDAVRALRGRTAPLDIPTIAFAAPAHITPVECSNAPTDGFVTHVLDRSGRSVTIVRVDDGERTFGPTDAPQSGRVPDSCRRILGLATAAPTAPILDFVVAAWLEIVTLRALEDPSMSWSAMVALHPAAASLRTEPTAAEVARATSELGASLDWERFRTVIASLGGFPFGEGAETTAAWMDAGMFSRWALDEVGDPDSLLELLDATVSPAVAERLWAAVQLIEGAQLEH